MNPGANNTYLGNIKESISSLLLGLRLSIRHFFEARKSRKPFGIFESNYFDQKTGVFTLQYPKESIPVPDNGRYRLHNEIDDCIVCDKCAKICPVDCIEIEPIKAVEEIGKTSDGTPKRLYAAKFDIDMGKCCFCGLCTTVCPTECLTMTKAYDFSEFDVADHVYAFAEMTPLQILEKKQELEKTNLEKERAKAAKATERIIDENQEQKENSENKVPGIRPAFKPRMPAKPKTAADLPEIKPEDEAKNRALEIMRAKAQKSEEANKPKDLSQEATTNNKKPVFKPRVPLKPNISNKDIENMPPQNPEDNLGPGEQETSKAANMPEQSSLQSPKPVFKLKIKPRPENKELKEQSGVNYVGPPTEENKTKENTDDLSRAPEKEAPKVNPKPIFKPKIPPKKKEE